MGLADYSAFLHLSSDDSSEWVRPSRLSRCSYRIKNDRILLLRKLNTFSEVIQTFTSLDLLSLSCNGGMKLKHIPKVWRFWFGMVPRASLIPRSSKSMMWYVVDIASGLLLLLTFCWKVLTTYAVLERWGFIDSLTDEVLMGMKAASANKRPGSSVEVSWSKRSRLSIK